MDEASMNRYEKQLYSVFKTFDVDNEEALDRPAVHELCNALQLEDRGAALVNTLFERRSDRVTFAQFRNGLLAVLGGTSGETARAAAVPPEPPPQPDPPPHHSDDDSSGREVAPKFVFGSKKYGRRSRPPRSGTAADELPSPRSSSASRLDTDDKKARHRIRCRRSASAMESREDNILCTSDQDGAVFSDSYEHGRLINRDEAFALCRGLNMDGIDRRLVERIFNDTGNSDTTVGEFFDRLNASLTTTMEEARREERTPTTTGDGDAEAVDDEAAAGLPRELVLDAWERAGVQEPRHLLVELGFAGAALRPPELERALDDELRALTEPADESRDARALLLMASLALSRLRLEIVRRRADLAVTERNKLRGDVAEANRHARLLAQEVDESHARIEAELKANLRRSEARHAEAIRQAAAENTAEREHAATVRARLEAEVARRTEAEARLRGEMNGLRERTDELEARVTIAEERRAELERDRARLAAEIRAAAERGAAAQQCGAVGELAERVRDLRRDNQALRDRNDELLAALEARAVGAAPPDSTGGLLSTELELLTVEHSEECDSSLVSIEQRILGHVDAATRLREIFESVHALPRSGDAAERDGDAAERDGDAAERDGDAAERDGDAAERDGDAAERDGDVAERDGDDAERDRGACASCVAVAADVRRLQRAVRELCTAASNAPVPAPAAPVPAPAAPVPAPAAPVPASAAPASSPAARCHAAAQTIVEPTHDDNKQKLADLVKELESSLELMKAEYDKCEEYWSGKLEEERAAYAEEQRLGDERLAELVAKIAEYERQFAPTLPTIEERHSLEAQFTDLEEEFARYRHDKEAELAERAADAARLSEHVEALERRLEAVAGKGRAERSGAERVGHERGGHERGGPERVGHERGGHERGGAGAAEVRELRARTARAEAAARRLLARLAAADVLVKELYVENCQLAHRRPL